MRASAAGTAIVPNAACAVGRIVRDETDLRIAVKKAGGIWRPRQKLWEISWDVVHVLGIGHRVVTG